MSMVEFPSPMFPGFPAVTLSIPGQWTARRVPGTVLGVAKTRSPEEFASNVVVTLTREDAGTDPAVAVEAIDRYLDTLADLQVADRVVRSWGGWTWSIIEFAHVADGVGTVYQVIASTVIEHGGVCDLVRLTGSASAALVAEDIAEIRGVIASADVRVSAEVTNG